MRGSDHRRGIAAVVAHHARPAQQIHDIDAGRVARLGRDLLRPQRQRGQQFRIDLERAREHRGAKMQRTLDFAATHGAGDRLAKIRFRDAKFFGQAAADFQETGD